MPTAPPPSPRSQPCCWQSIETSSSSARSRTRTSAPRSCGPCYVSVGDRLRATRFRLIARRYDDDVAAIRALLAESASRLPVSSPLHKIPHYLEHRLTLADAFHCLDLLRDSANPVEHELAGLIGDALDKVRQELAIYQLLQQIYDEVAQAAPDATAEEVRTAFGAGLPPAVRTGPARGDRR